MPPRKTTTDLRAETAAIAEEVPESAIEATPIETGIPGHAGYEAELSDLRAQMSALNEQIAALAENARKKTVHLARQGEATVKLYPVSSLLTVAAIATAVGFALAGGRSQPPRSRYERSRDDVADFVEALRARLNI
ncbi:hypothetical protein DTW90_28895 [Neorhizobium sp. P12A]|uniref:hypothetical protein n=1 Tax=Rhizobium/Agrobacterium group TaxID=227290 RepID=UPI00104FC6DC|nr:MULTISPECIES: hypothetical protein [Rhizobium/Agrobacterium group]KAA0690924.1 hypothetical protein DTW90_28895 [Neorhizobium sp. P12A]TCR62324.1 hypothetical protein EV561_1804 [Rhizobium sp. BK376]